MRKNLAGFSKTSQRPFKMGIFPWGYIKEDLLENILVQDLKINYFQGLEEYGRDPSTPETAISLLFALNFLEVKWEKGPRYSRITASTLAPRVSRSLARSVLDLQNL